MTKLHEILAVEKTRTAASKDSIGETKKKFANHSQFFSGRSRTLTMFSDSPENAALQAAESSRQLPTTDVVSTLAYTLALWAQAQDIRATKDLTNTIASSAQSPRTLRRGAPEIMVQTRRAPPDRGLRR